MKPIEDLSGNIYGRLIAVSPAKTKDGRSGWLCNCKCGNTTIVKTHNLKSGNTKSCGCLFTDSLSSLNYIHGESGGAIEGKRTRLYRCWVNMKSRCYNPRVRSYHDYGLKGIKVCDSWNDFKTFSEWAYSHGYSDELTIDRVDSNKNYCPENCRWVSLSENSKLAHQKSCWGLNAETDEYVEFTCIRDFAKERNLSFSCIDRVLHGRNKTHKGWIFGYIN